MRDKIIDILKTNNLSLPRLLLLNYKQLNITEKELVFLIYIINEKDMSFNPKKISKELNEELTYVMSILESLMEKSIVRLELVKLNGVRNEILNIDELYVKLSHLVIIEEKETIKSTSIYDIFEEKFGRTLSPMEYAIIGGWIEMDFKEELILLALDEAIYNGVYKLNYIDKILFEWKKKNINSKEDKVKNENDFKTKKTEKKELYDYNWLEENE